METERNSVYSISDTVTRNCEKQFRRLKEKHKKYQQNKKFVPRYKNKMQTITQYASHMFQLGTGNVKRKGLI